MEGALSQTGKRGVRAELQRGTALLGISSNSSTAGFSNALGRERERERRTVVERS